MWGNLAFKLLGRDQFLKSNEVDPNGFVWTQGVCFAADEGTGEMRFCAANTWVINLIFAQLECCCSKVGNDFQRWQANNRSRMSSHVDYIWMNIFLNDMLQRYSIWFCTNLHMQQSSAATLQQVVLCDTNSEKGGRSLARALVGTWGRFQFFHFSHGISWYLGFLILPFFFCVRRY